MPKVTLKQLYDHCLTGNMLHQEFRFSTYNSSDSLSVVRGIPNCGTAGCLLGEMPALDPDTFYFAEHSGCLEVKTWDSLEDGTTHYFGISYETFSHLFIPFGQTVEVYGGKNLTPMATLNEVLENLRIYLETYDE